VSAFEIVGVCLQPTDRRAALAGLAAVPALLVAKPAEAAYGDSANVFGKMTNTSGTRGLDLSPA
jgi:hypothetical protein